MTLKLYGYTASLATKLAALVLLEKNVPYELVLVDMTQGKHKSPEYTEKQPFGQVPYIDDDGFILYESRAIARYICKKYPNQGPKLIPDNLKGEALFEQAASVESSNFFSPTIGFLDEKMFKKFRGQQGDEAAAQTHRSKIDNTLQVYEKILSKQKYIAGDEITIVDLFHLPYGGFLYNADAGDLIDSKPSVKRWFNEISSRPSWAVIKDGVQSHA